MLTWMNSSNPGTLSQYAFDLLLEGQETIEKSKGFQFTLITLALTRGIHRTMPLTSQMQKAISTLKNVVQRRDLTLEAVAAMDKVRFVDDLADMMNF